MIKQQEGTTPPCEVVRSRTVRIWVRAPESAGRHLYCLPSAQHGFSSRVSGDKHTSGDVPTHTPPVNNQLASRALKGQRLSGAVTAQQRLSSGRHGRSRAPGHAAFKSAQDNRWSRDRGRTQTALTRGNAGGSCFSVKLYCREKCKPFAAVHNSVYPERVDPGCATGVAYSSGGDGATGVNHSSDVPPLRAGGTAPRA